MKSLFKSDKVDNPATRPNSSLMRFYYSKNPNFTQMRDDDETEAQPYSDLAGTKVGVLSSMPEFKPQGQPKLSREDSFELELASVPLDGKPSYLAVLLGRFYSKYDKPKIGKILSEIIWTKRKGMDALNNKLNVQYNANLGSIEKLPSDPLPDSDWQDIRKALTDFYKKHEPKKTPEQFQETFYWCIQKGAEQLNELLKRKFGEGLASKKKRRTSPPVCTCYYLAGVVLFMLIAAGVGLGVGMTTSTSNVSAVASSTPTLSPSAPTTTQTLAPVTPTPTAKITASPVVAKTTSSPTTAQTFPPTTRPPTAAATFSPTTRPPTQAPVITAAPTPAPTSVPVSCTFTFDKDAVEAFVAEQEVTIGQIGSRFSFNFVDIGAPNMVIAVKGESNNPGDEGGFKMSCSSSANNRWHNFETRVSEQWKVVLSNTNNKDDFDADVFSLITGSTLTSVRSSTSILPLFVSIGSGDCEKLWVDASTKFVVFRATVS